MNIQTHTDANRNNVLPEVAKLIADRFFNEQFHAGSEDITLDTRFREDLGLDSLDVLDAALTAEVHFEVKIPVDSLRDIRTVRDLIDMLLTLNPSLCTEEEK